MKYSADFRFREENVGGHFVRAVIFTTKNTKRTEDTEFEVFVSFVVIFSRVAFGRFAQQNRQVRASPKL